MRKISAIFIAALLSISYVGQQSEQFNIEIEPVNVTNMPGFQSYSWAKTTDGKWLIVGGRLDGLHQRQPFSSFLAADNNTSVYLIDVINDQVWTGDLSVLPAAIFEQIQSTNQQFVTIGNYLYVIGGYGYSATVGDHITYHNITAIDIDGVANALMNNSPLTATGLFRQIVEDNVALTGAQAGIIDTTVYLVGGHEFIGRYNPMGPNNGPGFIQNYSSELKKFGISDDGTNFHITGYSTQKDTINLHRRDYNMVPQIFPNGELGFTVFTGVFRADTNLPFLNTVDVTGGTYNVVPDFNQYLSQYQSAKLPIYDSTYGAMQTIFFGGISQYTMDTSGNLVVDLNVPFVKTISKVVRYPDSTMEEIKLPIEMPVLVGAGSDFIPAQGISYINNEILDMNSIPQTRTLVGYIVGGIESTAANIFTINDGTQSSASTVVYAVYVNKSTTGINHVLDDEHVFNLNVYPLPVQDRFNLEFLNPSAGNVEVKIFNIQGQIVYSQSQSFSRGKQLWLMNRNGLSSGIYTLQLSNADHRVIKKLILN